MKTSGCIIRRHGCNQARCFSKPFAARALPAGIGQAIRFPVDMHFVILFQHITGRSYTDLLSETFGDLQSISANRLHNGVNMHRIMLVDDEENILLSLNRSLRKTAR